MITNWLGLCVSCYLLQYMVKENQPIMRKNISHDDLDGQASTARLPNNPIHYYACCSLIK